MKFFILILALCTAYAIPRRTPQLAEVYLPEETEFPIASTRLSEPTFSEFDARFQEPVDELYPEEQITDEAYPIDEYVNVLTNQEYPSVDLPTAEGYPDEADNPTVDLPTDEGYPVEADYPRADLPTDDFYPVDEIIPEEETPILGNEPDETPVDPTTDDDDTFIYIRNPSIPSFHHPFMQRPFSRQDPMFPWVNRDNNQGPFFTRPAPRRPSFFDILFRKPYFEREMPDMFHHNHQEYTPRRPDSHNGFHSVFNNFFNQPRRPILPTFKFDSVDYPANFTNTTHKIHDVNGTKFSVNTTVRKHSGDNFSNFFHVRVVQRVPEVPIEEEEAVTSESPATEEEIVPVETPVTEEEFLPAEIPDTEESDVLPTRGDTFDTLDETVKDNVIPLELPEIYNDSENEVVQTPEGWMHKLSPHSHMFNDQPHLSGYVKKPFRQYIPVDLSGDTEVNRGVVSGKSQTLTRPNAEAEVFDLGLVVKEMQGNNE